MVWEPFLLAIGFGLAVSAGIYFAILWPQVEPLDDDELAALEPAEVTPSTPAAEPAAPPPAAKPSPSETTDDVVS